MHNHRDSLIQQTLTGHTFYTKACSTLRVTATDHRHSVRSPRKGEKPNSSFKFGSQQKKRLYGLTKIPRTTDLCFRKWMLRVVPMVVRQAVRDVVYGAWRCLRGRYVGSRGQDQSHTVKYRPVIPARESLKQDEPESTAWAVYALSPRLPGATRWDALNQSTDQSISPPARAFNTKIPT